MTQNLQPSERASVWRQLKAIMDRSPADNERVRSRFSDAQLKRFEDDELSTEAVRSLTHPNVIAKFAEFGIDVDRTWVAGAKEAYDPQQDWLPQLLTRTDVLEALRFYHETFGPELLREFMDGESVHQFYVKTKSRVPAPDFLRKIVAFLSNEARYGAPVRQLTRVQLFYWKAKRRVFGARDQLPSVTDHATFSTWVEKWYRPKSRHALGAICDVGPNAFRTWIKGSATPTQEKLTGVLRGVHGESDLAHALDFQASDPKAPLLDFWVTDQDAEAPTTDAEIPQQIESVPEPEATDAAAPKPAAEEPPAIPEPVPEPEPAPVDDKVEPEISEAGQRRLLALSDLLAEQADEDTDVVKHLAAATKAQRARRARADALFHFVRSNEEERERELAKMQAAADARVSNAENAAVVAQEAAEAAREAAEQATQQLEQLRAKMQAAAEVPDPPAEPEQEPEPEPEPRNPMDDLIAGRTEPGERRGDIRFVLTADNWTPITDSFTPKEVEDTGELIYELARRLSVLNQMDPELRVIVVDELAGPLRSLYLGTNNLDAEERPAVLNDIATSLEVYAEDEQN